MAVTDFGTDFACQFDLDPSLTVISGRQVLAESTLRRLITGKGGLFYDPAYGYDISDEIGRAFGERVSGLKVEAEALQDERVEDARADVTFVFVPEAIDEKPGDLQIDLRLVDEDGPFDLTFNIDGTTGQATVELLDENT